MRLLNINTKELREFGEEPPAYVIASHRWTNEEITLTEWQNQKNADKFGFKKVERFCKFVREWGAELDLHWLWIDTCCIAKGDANELSEAINSMFRWYEQACLCVAFLHDVLPMSCEPTRILDSFEHSVWFTRGWTLQELLAPQMVVFLNQEWEVFGHKASTTSKPPQTLNLRGMSKRALTGHGLLLPLNHIISNITSIPKDILDDFSKSKKLDNSTKLDWMKGRQTGKVEDRAYALLGICDISMPLCYGEGAKAMQRLEEAIERAYGKGKVPSRKEKKKGPSNSDPLFPGFPQHGFPPPLDPFGHNNHRFPDPFENMNNDRDPQALPDPFEIGVPDPFRHNMPAPPATHPAPQRQRPEPARAQPNPSDPHQIGACVDSFLQSVHTLGYIHYNLLFEGLHRSTGKTTVQREYAIEDTPWERGFDPPPPMQQNLDDNPFRPNDDYLIGFDVNGNRYSCRDERPSQPYAPPYVEDIPEEGDYEPKITPTSSSSRGPRKRGFENNLRQTFKEETLDNAWGKQKQWPRSGPDPAYDDPNHGEPPFLPRKQQPMFQ